MHTSCHHCMPVHAVMVIHASCCWCMLLIRACVHCTIMIGRAPPAPRKLAIISTPRILKIRSQSRFSLPMPMVEVIIHVKIRSPNLSAATSQISCYIHPLHMFTTSTRIYAKLWTHSTTNLQKACDVAKLWAIENNLASGIATMSAHIKHPFSCKSHTEAACLQCAHCLGV